MLPLPETVTSSEAASCVLRESLLRRAVTVYSPTPPLKEAGAPAGSWDTRTETAGVVTRLRMVVYPSSKKLSKMLLPRRAVCTLTRQTISAGSICRVPDFCGISTQRRSRAAS